MFHSSVLIQQCSFLDFFKKLFGKISWQSAEWEKLQKVRGLSSEGNNAEWLRSDVQSVTAVATGEAGSCGRKAEELVAGLAEEDGFEQS